MIRVGFAATLKASQPRCEDHVKRFFPDGAAPAGGEQPMAGRDYTPRRYDAASNTLEVDFVLHDAGPATRWATQAAVGQAMSIGGPRGSFIIPTTFDWHLLAGDDTALPAIGRRLAELPSAAAPWCSRDRRPATSPIRRAPRSASLRASEQARPADRLLRYARGSSCRPGRFYAGGLRFTTAKLMRARDRRARRQSKGCASGYWRAARWRCTTT